MKTNKVPKNIETKFNAINNELLSCSKKLLDDEYYDKCNYLALKLARKRPSPLTTGKTLSWVAAIVHTIGFVNFLFDKSTQPYVSAAELADYFNLSSKTIAAKGKKIRDLMKIHQLEPEYSLQNNLINNPCVWLLEINGIILDIRQESYAFQKELFEAGIIPFIPADKIVS